MDGRVSPGPKNVHIDLRLLACLNSTWPHESSQLQEFGMRSSRVQWRERLQKKAGICVFFICSANWWSFSHPKWQSSAWGMEKKQGLRWNWWFTYDGWWEVLLCSVWVRVCVCVCVFRKYCKKIHQVRSRQPSAATLPQAPSGSQRSNQNLGLPLTFWPQL